jgi:hypothetical protein
MPSADGGMRIADPTRLTALVTPDLSLAQLLPLLQAAVHGHPTTLTTADMAALERLLDAFAVKASPRLQWTIEQLRSDLRSGKLLSLFGVIEIPLADEAQ